MEDLKKLPELSPPVNVMPHGNVGTPTKIFLELIRDCKLPPALIGKLGLTFPKSRAKRKYGDVPFDYGGDILQGEEENSVYSANGFEIECENSELQEGRQKQKDNDTEGAEADTDKHLSEPESEEVYMLQI